jgi:hypothetical protein
MCGGIELGVAWPSHCRSTPELVRLQAHLSAALTYRPASDLLEQLFPVDAGKHPETVRRHTLKVGESLQNRITTRPETAAPTIVVTLDSTFIRSCEDGERHLEVRVGNVETKSGRRQVFGTVAKAHTDIKVLINRSLDAIGRTEQTALTAFTDGCSGLRRILADAGVTKLPFFGLVPYRNEIAASEANRQWSVMRRSGAGRREIGDRRRGRTPALAAVEWQSDQRPDKHRSHPIGHASF